MADPSTRRSQPQHLPAGTGAGDRADVGDETEDAIEGHNGIRDTWRAVDEDPVASDA